MPLLALHSVSKAYGALKVTDDISLSVDEGETLGILGPNGAGKTTLFNLICGDVRCDAGRVEYEGRDITHAEAAPALPRRHRPQLPGAAALRPHDGVREPGHRRLLRRPASPSARPGTRAHEVLEQTGLLGACQPARPAA